MKKLITILLILSTGLTYGQTWQWPNLDLYSRAGQVQIRNNIAYAVNRKADSLEKVFDAKLKLLEAKNDKNLKDSFATLIPPDNKTIVVKDGKFTAVGGGTTDLTPVYDTIAKLDAKLTASNAALTNAILILSCSVTSVKNKVSALERWRIEATAELKLINSKIATIPKTAVSTSTSTTTTTTTTELKP